MSRYLQHRTTGVTPPEAQAYRPTRRFDPSREYAVSRARADELRAEWQRIADASPNNIGIGPEANR